MAFPASPTNGQQVTINYVTYQYDTTNTAWYRVSSYINEPLLTAGIIASQLPLIHANNAWAAANNAWNVANTASGAAAWNTANTALGTATAAFVKANTASGSNNQIQFNNNSQFSSSQNLTFDTTTSTLQVIGSLTSNNISYTNLLTTKSILETATVNGSAPAATENFDTITQSVSYYTTAATTNFTLNIRGNSSTSLDSIMSTGSSITIAVLVTNTGTAYYPNVIQIDGTTVTPKWQGGTAISAGNASAIDVYSFSILKTASATYTVLASQTKFA